MSEANPFDDCAGQEGAEKRCIRAQLLAKMLRGISAISFTLAIASACAVLVLDCARHFGFLSWRLKSAFPLIFVGISYSSLLFTLPRTRREFLLGMAVAVAFILWGAEQFVPDPGLAALMDDGVVFLFVMDLGIVIWGYLIKKMHLKWEGG
ncbi:MAG TPA: hypothetical protein VG733_08995 [Chthoniobacteraceae bacterium]|nr:hypothetical protein [Chthoniobacteraceae bacterium]